MSLSAAVCTHYNNIVHLTHIFYCMAFKDCTNAGAFCTVWNVVVYIGGGPCQVLGTWPLVVYQ